MRPFVMFDPSGMATVRLLVMHRRSRTERKELFVMRDTSGAVARWGRGSPKRLRVDPPERVAFQPGMPVVREDPPFVRQ